MSATTAEKKQKAIELLNKLGIYKPYIDGFVKEDQVCLYERFGGYWVFQEPEIEKKMKEIEKKYNAVCYAITHEYLEFGECYSFLLVTNYKCDWKNLVQKAGQNDYYAMCYVWNKDYECCSELGSIVVRSWGGGLCRVG